MTNPLPAQSNNKQHVPSKTLTADHHREQEGDGFGNDMPFYVPPRQRQRWGETQHSVHNNWGDIFFDLFYVALAYNLGNVLREDPTNRGLLYVCACFLPLIGLWHLKMYWDARFVNDGGDLFHVLLEVATYVCVASAVEHVRPVAILTDLDNNFDMFAFCVSLLLGHVLFLARIVEVALCVKVFQSHGLYEEAYHATKRDAIWVAVPAVFYLAACIYSGKEYFGSDTAASSHETVSLSSYHDDYYGDEEHRRALAGTTSSFYTSASESDTPAWLCLAGTLASQMIIVLVFMVWLPAMKRAGVDIQTVSIPMNIGYSIHRYGEWTMLLLGESVLSLLIVDLSSGWSYYQTFFTGVLSVILLEYLHFRSQPHDPDEHALRKSVLGGFIFTNLMYVYSVALVVLGTTYKMFLFEFVYENTGERRFLSPLVERLLAGGESAALRFNTDDRQQRIAHFFAGSLAIVFLCLDGMSMAHKGIGKSMERCHCETTHRYRATVVLLLIFRVALVIVFATLSQYCTDPSLLATLGFVGVVLQLFIRVLGSFLFPVNEEEQEEQALDRVANYLNARIHN